MSSKRIFSLTILIGLILLVAVGCTPAAATQEPPPQQETEPTAVPAVEEPPEPEIRMAVLLSGTVDDLSWNYQMQQAALKVAQEHNFEVDFSEKVPAADAERVIREFADNGYNFIIAHSFNYGEPLFLVAPDYPDVNFAWPGGIEKTADNIADYDQPFYQAAYIMGVMAGGVSESGTFSFLSGFDIPVCHSMYEAFRMGALTTNPDSEMLYTVVGDWADVAKAKEATLAHIDTGADYVASCGFGPTLGAIEAAEERDIFASSYVGDMSSIAPDNVLLSMVWDLYPLISLFVEEIEAGSFKPGKYYSYGVANDALKVVVNPALTDAVPASTMEDATQVINEIKSGAFEVPYKPEGDS